MQDTITQKITAPAIRFVECPRDAMQGWKHIIPTEKKVEYINALLNVGFDTIDFGSFVSPKAIPQMADTKEVVRQLTITGNTTKLLAIVANVRGAEEAIFFEQIACLGFPFSVSPTFQLRNTNSTIEQSLETVDIIKNLCVQSSKELVVYLSMGFGNPYGDQYSEELVMTWVDKLVTMEVKIISLADTVGLAEPIQISSVLNKIIPQYPQIEFGVHLHSTSQNRVQKIDAAFLSGCMRFDGALKGIGGCPMANDALVGNMDTEFLLAYFQGNSILPSFNKDALHKALILADEIFK